MLKKKQIYFVRHGETEFNAKNIRQGREGHLNENGRKQAAFVAERFKNIPVEVIIASPFTRTQETAQIIQEVIKVPIETSELLAERRNPHEIIGRLATDPDVSTILDRIDRSFHDNSSRYSDEENFDDLKGRAKKLLRFLEQRPESRILCVSHYLFLETLASYIEVGDKLTSHQVTKFTFLNQMNNAGITVCTYEPQFKGFWRKRAIDPHDNIGWKLVVWNDYGRINPEEEEKKDK